MDTEIERKVEETNEHWTEKLLFIKEHQTMSTLLTQATADKHSHRYNQAIHVSIHKCYKLLQDPVNTDKDKLEGWIQLVCNALLSMVNKHNRNQIAFLKLAQYIHCHDLKQIMDSLSTKLNGITVPSFEGLYALFHCCFAKKGEPTEGMLYWSYISSEN